MLKIVILLAASALSLAVFFWAAGFSLVTAVVACVVLIGSAGLAFVSWKRNNVRQRD